jgi:hypothetical protein
MDVTPANGLKVAQSFLGSSATQGTGMFITAHTKARPHPKQRHLCHVIDNFGSSCKVTVSNLGPQTGCPELKCNLLGCFKQWFGRPQSSSWTSLIFLLATSSTPAVGPQYCLSGECRLLLNKKCVKLCAMPRLGMYGGVQPLPQSI